MENKTINIEVPEGLDDDMYISKMFGFPDFENLPAKTFEDACFCIGEYLRKCNKVHLDPGIYQMVLGSLVAALPNAKICKDVKKVLTDFLKEGICSIETKEDMEKYMEKKEKEKKANGI